MSVALASREDIGKPRLVLPAETRESLERLAWQVRTDEGFALYCVVVDPPDLIDVCAGEFASILGPDVLIEHVELGPPVERPVHAILASVADDYLASPTPTTGPPEVPRAVFVFGLSEILDDTYPEHSRVLYNLNLERDRLLKLGAPAVFWLTPDGLRRIQRGAPDFSSFIGDIHRVTPERGSRLAEALRHTSVAVRAEPPNEPAAEWPKTPEELGRGLEELRPRLLRYALRSGLDPEEAQDALQAALLSLWERESALVDHEAARQERFGSLTALAIVELRKRITRSRYLRTGRRTNELHFTDTELSELAEVTDPTLDPLNAVLSDAEREQTREALATLPRLEQEIFSLWMADLNRREITSILGLSDSQTRMLMQRARRRLHAALSTSGRPEGQSASPASPVLAVRTVDTQPVVGSTRRNEIDGAEMVWIPPGEFLMGSALEEIDSLWRRFDWPPDWKRHTKDEQPRHPVTLTRGFWMYRNEVTVAMYRRFCQAAGREMPDAPSWGWQDSHPIVNVSWSDAQAYCHWAGARLPTEAEWEYAARGGNTGLNGKPHQVFVWGDDLPRGKANVGNLADETAKRALGHVGWDIFAGYEDGYVYTAPVGSFAANGFGLFDMAGNVWEWCADRYADDYYRKSPLEDPMGPDNANISSRVLRGGSWNSDPYRARVAYRNRLAHVSRRYSRGFRCVAFAAQDG
jgi:iron(II)-dependent oxidoreductase